MIKTSSCAYTWLNTLCEIQKEKYEYVPKLSDRITVAN